MLFVLAVHRIPLQEGVTMFEYTVDWAINVSLNVQTLSLPLSLSLSLSLYLFPVRDCINSSMRATTTFFDPLGDHGDGNSFEQSYCEFLDEDFCMIG